MLDILNRFDIENKVSAEARKDIEMSMLGVTTSPTTSSTIERELRGPNSLIKTQLANAAARQEAKREFEAFCQKAALKLAQQRELLRVHAHAPGKASTDEITNEKEQRLEQVKAINAQQVKLDTLIVAEEEIEDLIQARDLLVNQLQEENAAQRNSIVNDIADAINHAGMTGPHGELLMDEEAREILRNVATGAEMQLYNAMHPELNLIPQSTAESEQARVAEQAQIDQLVNLRGLSNMLLRTYFIHQLKNEVEGVDNRSTLQRKGIDQLNEKAGPALKMGMTSNLKKLNELAEKHADSLADLKKRNAQIQDRRVRVDADKLKLIADVVRAFEKPLVQKLVVNPVSSTAPRPLSTKLNPYGNQH